MLITTKMWNFIRLSFTIGSKRSSIVDQWENDDISIGSADTLDEPYRKIK